MALFPFHRHPERCFLMLVSCLLLKRHWNSKSIPLFTLVDLYAIVSQENIDIFGLPLAWILQGRACSDYLLRSFQMSDGHLWQQGWVGGSWKGGACGMSNGAFCSSRRTTRSCSLLGSWSTLQLYLGDCLPLLEKHNHKHFGIFVCLIKSHLGCVWFLLMSW